MDSEMIREGEKKPEEPQIENRGEVGVAESVVLTKQI